MRTILMVMGLIVVVALIASLLLVATPMARVQSDIDLFGFNQVSQAAETTIPPQVQRYASRDGSNLAFRHYGSQSTRALIMIHGSSYHGAAYDGLARELSDSNRAAVYLPNLRGHHLSGARRGDVDYIGQLEDDVADLIAHIRAQGHAGEIFLGGHSSGAGLAIRFAGGKYRKLVDGFLLLAPVIPTAPSIQDGDAGGWAILNERRLIGLLALNAIGFTGLNGLPVIQFNKPEKFWDGTETLTYSYRLNQSYHPRYDYAQDIRAMGDQVLVFIGAALGAPAMREVAHTYARETQPQPIESVGGECLVALRLPVSLDETEQSSQEAA